MPRSKIALKCLSLILLSFDFGSYTRYVHRTPDDHVMESYKRTLE